MSTMKRLFEDIQEISRLQRSQPPEAVDLCTIIHLASGERKVFWSDDEASPDIY